jgi:hypothetical protein
VEFRLKLGCQQALIWGIDMTQRGRHRAPGRHARPKERNLPFLAAVMGGVVLLTGSAVVQANSSEQPAPYIDVVSMAIDGTVTYNVRNHDISTSVVTDTEPIKFASTVNEDANIAAGTEIIHTTGINGAAEVTYEVKVVDGKEVSRTEIGRIVKTEPRNELVIRGTGDAKNLKIALQTAAGTTGSVAGNMNYAKLFIQQEYGWDASEFKCLAQLWTRESKWNHIARNRTSGAYGIPQSLPGAKMQSFGSDWATNPVTQIKWGADYIQKRYDTPCNAWQHSQIHNWY